MVDRLHRVHTVLMTRKGLRACSLHGCYFPMIATVLSTALLVLALFSSSPMHRNGGSTFPPWLKPVRHPVVFFPGFSTSRIKVTVVNQSFSSTCPPSASFDFHSGYLPPWSFPEECAMESLRVNYNESASDPGSRFYSQPGVTVELADFGSVQCAPIYYPLFLRLMAGGYTSGKTLFVACYDFRMAPNVDVTPGHTFLEASRLLIEEAYESNGGKKVFLLAHSNGSPMALHLLHSLPDTWRTKHIGGFISYAGNWVGQGSFIQYIFSGFSFFDFSTPRPDFAFTTQTWPAVYFSMAQPGVYKSSEVILKAGGRVYTPANCTDIFQLPGLEIPKRLFPMFNGLVNASKASMVDTYAFYGSGIPTRVGIELEEVQQGVAIKHFVYGTGDGDQEDTDNLFVLQWEKSMAGLVLQVFELVHTQHLLVPFHLKAMRRTMDILSTVQLGSIVREEIQLTKELGMTLGSLVGRNPKTPKPPTN